MEKSLQQKSIDSFFWKTGESICTLGITFVIQIVLARILAPEDFGIVGITTVFMTLANTIIETSFSSAVIQRSRIDQDTLSSIFYANLGLSVVVYLLLYLLAPLIAGFYEVDILIPIIRVQGLRVVLSALYSVQTALLHRDMRFKASFFCCLIGSVVHGAVGIAMAYMGAGIWAIVISALVGYCVSGVLIMLVSGWYPRLFFSAGLIRDAMSFSSKVLAVRIVRKLFYNIRALAIGKVYDSTTLGYFDKGFQFPSTAMTVVDGSLTSVAFTTLAKQKEDGEKFLASLRRFVGIMMYICTPIMVGMMLVAEPLVLVLLTSKWADCIPFLQIVCMTQLLIPLNVKTTAFEALGRSDLSMKLHVSSVVLSIILLLCCVRLPAYVMVLSGLASSVILQIAVTIVSKKVLGYAVKDQLIDMAAGLVPSAIMTAGILLLNLIPCGALLKLIVEVMTGILLYVAGSYVTGNQYFRLILDVARKVLHKHKKETVQ